MVYYGASIRLHFGEEDAPDKLEGDCYLNC